MRNLLLVAAGIAVAVVLWPYVPGVPSLSSLFGGTTHTIPVTIPTGPR
jgi:hypothetical protein